MEDGLFLAEILERGIKQNEEHKIPPEIEPLIRRMAYIVDKNDSELGGEWISWPIAALHVIRDLLEVLGIKAGRKYRRKK